MFARRWAQLGEKQSGTALITGPDNVGVAVECNVRAGQNAAKSQIRTHGHGFGGLNAKPVLADVDADAGKRSAFEVEIDQAFSPRSE